MEITYMQNIRKYLEKNAATSQSGNSEQDIERIESDYNRKFPKAYKELLFLAGKGFVPFGFDFGTDWMEENVWPSEKEWMKACEDKVKSAYWIIGTDEGGPLIIYLDEGENPAVYYCEIEAINIRSDWYRKIADSLSQFAQTWIDYHRQYGY